MTLAVSFHRFGNAGIFGRILRVVHVFCGCRTSYASPEELPRMHSHCEHRSPMIIVTYGECLFFSGAVLVTGWRHFSGGHLQVEHGGTGASSRQSLCMHGSPANPPPQLETSILVPALPWARAGIHVSKH
jgi:hypothetical protein